MPNSEQERQSLRQQPAEVKAESEAINQARQPLPDKDLAQVNGGIINSGSNRMRPKTND